MLSTSILDDYFQNTNKQKIPFDEEIIEFCIFETQQQFRQCLMETNVQASHHNNGFIEWKMQKKHEDVMQNKQWVL